MVLATLPSLEAGAARALFAQWAEEPHNALIFTDRPPPGTLGRRVLPPGVFWGFRVYVFRGG